MHSIPDIIPLWSLDDLLNSIAELKRENDMLKKTNKTLLQISSSYCICEEDTDDDGEGFCLDCGKERV